MSTNHPANGDERRPRTERVEWGIRADIGGPTGLTFTLFKRTAAAFSVVSRWDHFVNSCVPEPVLFDMVAYFTQRFTDDLLMSPGVQLVLPLEA